MSIIENEKITFDFVYRDEDQATPIKFFHDENDVAKIAITVGAQNYTFSAKMLEEIVNHLKSRGALKNLSSPKGDKKETVVLPKENQYEDFMGLIDTRDVGDDVTGFGVNISDDDSEDFEIGAQLDNLTGKTAKEKEKKPVAPLTREQIQAMAAERNAPKTKGKAPPKPVTRRD